MTWIAVAAAGGAIVAGGLSYAGAQQASKAAQKGTDASIAEQRREFDIINSQTAPYRAIGQQALNTLGSIYGYQPAANYFGPSAPAGSTLLQPSGSAGSQNLWGSMFDPNKLLGLNPNSTLGKIIDPVHALFGSKHGDEKRNLKAFTSENQVYDLGNGMLALADGTVFPQSELQELAGTWYGATYHPDGDQAGWQQKYNDVLSRIKALPQNQQLAQQQNAFAYSPNGSIDPRLAAGQGMAQSSAPLTAPDYSAFYKSPDYEFRRSEGTRGIENSFSASGGAKSGNALRALAEFNSNLAAGEFGNYFNRQAALAGIGQTATNTSANAALQTGANISNSLIAGANARASGIASGTNALNSTLGTLGGIAYNYFNRPSGIGGYGSQAVNYLYGSGTPGVLYG